MPTNKNNKPLGQGLAALIRTEASSEDSAYKENFDIKKIEANPYQPRMRIDPEDLIDLADSIREKGIIQPLIITKTENSDKYHLIAGERRLKAAQLAGLKRVPVVIKDSSPQEMLELALIENIQREDLNAIEEASAFKQLQDEFNLKHAEIAKKVGLSRVAVTNKIRLLNLPDQVKEYVLGEEISEGHARAILGLRDHQSICAAANIIIKRNLSVREAEQLVRRISYSKEENIDKTRKITKEIEALEQRITKKLGFDSKINKLTNGGKIVIKFKDEAELRELTERLTR
jgi:ParB family transcriptional regulator, chromosome partitioning protein